MVFFNGTSNVYKSGQNLEAKYHQIYFLYGVKYCILILFSAAANIPAMKTLNTKTINRFLYQD